MDEHAVIQVNAVSKYYGDTNAVDQVSFQVHRGEIFSIIGKVGAGKTTLLELLVGLVSPDSGYMKVLGLDIPRDAELLKNHINFYMQSTSLVDKMSVREALETFQGFYNCQGNIDCILSQFGLEPYANKLIKHLSGGLRQLMMLAVAVVHDPSIIFLDEPTTGLDLQAKREYWSVLAALKERGKTIVITSYDMEGIQQYSDRVGIMRSGELVKCSTPNSLIAGLPSGGLTMEAVYMHYAVDELGGVEI